MNLQPEALAGEYDVYSNGVHSELTLAPAGTFTHILWGGVQGYWGNWSLQQAAEGPVLCFNLAGSHPEVYFGPSGPQTMQWPEQENWLITSVAGNQITTTDAILVRKDGMALSAPAFAAPAAQFQPEQFPSPLFSPPPQPAAPGTSAHAQAQQFVAQISTPQPAAPQPHPLPAPPPNTLTGAQQAAANAATQNQINAIYASIAQQDQQTTNSINNQWTQLYNQQIANIQALNLQAMNNTHAMAKAYTLYAAS